MQLTQTINKIVRYAIAVTEPEEIVLFGSIAHGKGNEYSDVDLLIIIEDATYKKELSARIQGFVVELALRADVLIYSQSEWIKEMANPLSFIKAAYNSGRLLYKKNKNFEN